uniref:Uncharacterized protein n=1 Tax=Anguilla anguilla TaxID=7936 RepID=A0A0E9Y0N8_ANGAN
MAMLYFTFTRFLVEQFFFHVLCKVFKIQMHSPIGLFHKMATKTGCRDTLFPVTVATDASPFLTAKN